MVMSKDFSLKMLSFSVLKKIKIKKKIKEISSVVTMDAGSPRFDCCLLFKKSILLIYMSKIVGIALCRRRSGFCAVSYTHLRAHET